MCVTESLGQITRRLGLNASRCVTLRAETVSQGWPRICA